MLRNYFTIAARNLRRQPGYSLINIGGLGLGLACCFLIVLFVRHELSFDRFHRDADHLYRITRTSTAGTTTANTASGYAVDLQPVFPEIEEAVRFDIYNRSPYLRVDDESRRVSRFAFIDPNVFEVFDFPLVQGDPATVLDAPNALVLSESAAESLFGDTNPVGQTLTYNDRLNLTVTGIMADVPTNSHLQFDYAATFDLMTELMGEDALHDYTNYNYFTYVRLAPGTNPRLLNQKLADWARERASDEATLPRLQALSDIHFTTDLRFDVPGNRDIRYLYAFGLIGLLILLIACINFMNLATARAARRAREVGVRKVMGAGQGQLIRQFLGESVLLSVLALILALVLAALLLPVFNDLLGTEARLGGEFDLVAILVGIGLLAGLLAGSYPAFYLSSFNPATVLKGEVTRGRGASILRRGLIVAQFAISVFLLVSTLTVFNQVQHMRNRHLGFDQEQVVFAQINPTIRENFDVLRENLLASPDILSVTHTNGLPGRTGNMRGYFWPGESTDEEEGRGIYTVIADPDYIETLGLNLVAGRNFSRDLASDIEEAYIVNETAVRELGWTGDPVGHSLRVWDRPEMGRVIGVVEDFHFKSLHQQIEPLVITLSPPWQWGIAVRLAPGRFTEGLDHMREQWTTFAPGYVFDYQFLDQDFDRLYRADTQLMQRVGFFAAIAIFIACLGLFGLATYVAERRTKEIGVRKVLGASVPSIVGLLSGHFLRLVLVAFVIAAPIAFFAMTRWQENFAYRAGIPFWIFLIAGCTAVLIALVAVGSQALKAATLNPTLALRHE